MIADVFDQMYAAQHADANVGTDLRYRPPGAAAALPPVRGVLTTALNAEFLGGSAAATRRSNAEVRKADLPAVERGGRFETARGVFEVVSIEDDDRGLLWRLGLRKVPS